MKRLHLFVVALMATCGMQLKTSAQMCPYPVDNCNSCVSINLPPNPTICQGSSFAFNLGSAIGVPLGMTIGDWSWTPATGVSPSSGIYPATPGLTTFTPLVTTAYTLSVDALGPNLINDGDFSSFSTTTPCFYTDYNYYSGSSMYTNTQYGVTNNPNSLVTTFFVSMGDHTTGTGPMFVANGSTTVTTTPIVWEENRIPVCEGKTYVFSMWYANVDPPGGGPETANLQIDINGTTYGLYTPTPSGVWLPIYITWTAPAGTIAADIKVLDVNTWDNYNDFAIDDISFNRLCKASANFTVNVDVPSISGPTDGCIGNVLSMTGTPAGGTWSSSPGVTVDALGNVTCVTVGTSTITYTDPFGCTAMATVTVNPNPITFTGGPSVLCQWQYVALTASPSGGSWTYSGGLWPTTTFGTYHAIAPGPATITYYQGGCYADYNVTVNPVPDPLPPYYLCIGDVIPLPASPPGGTWSSTLSTVASVTSGGTLTAVAPGTATLVYTLPTGCSASTIAHVYNCDSGVIVGPGALCQGSSTYLIGLPAGGTWISGNTSIATVDLHTGFLTAVGGGTVAITYTVGSIVRITYITIYPPETACAREVTSAPGYPITSGPYVDFYTSCTSPGCTIYYNLYDASWHPVGHTSTYPYTTAPGYLPYSTLYSYPGCSQAYYLCVIGVMCNGCYWPVGNCCMNLNDPNWKRAPQSNTEPVDYGKLAVIPNPNTGTFNLRGALDMPANVKEVQVEVIDMLGKTVFTDVAALDNGEIDKSITLSSNLANGVYLVKIKGDNSGQILRFVLDR